MDRKDGWRASKNKARKEGRAERRVNGSQEGRIHKLMKGWERKDGGLEGRMEGWRVRRMDGRGKDDKRAGRKNRGQAGRKDGGKEGWRERRIVGGAE